MTRSSPLGSVAFAAAWVLIIVVWVAIVLVGWAAGTVLANALDATGLYRLLLQVGALFVALGTAFAGTGSSRG